MCMLLSRNHLLTTQQWHPRQKTRVLTSSCSVQHLLCTVINRGLCSLLVSRRVYCHIGINGNRNRSNLFQNICSHGSLSHQQSSNVQKGKADSGKVFPFQFDLEGRAFLNLKIKACHDPFRSSGDWTWAPPHHWQFTQACLLHNMLSKENISW